MKIKLLPTKIALILTLLIFLLPFNEKSTNVQAFSNQVIQQGAIGTDVIELQSRLQYIGYYNGKIDGVFGWRTYWALRNFQYEFGIPIDGLAGEETKQKLLKATRYNKGFVNEQLKKGNRFTHYGGMDLSKQTAPRNSQSKGKQQGRMAKQEPQQGQPNVANPKIATTPKKIAPQVNPNTARQANPNSMTLPKNSGPQTNPKIAAQPKNSAKQATPNTGTQSKMTGPQTNQNNTAKPKKTAPQANPKIAAKPKNVAPKATQKNATKPKSKPKVAAQPKKPTAVNTPNGFAQNDINLMANAVYGESRGEPYTGQVAVAAVIINRVNSASFPNTVSGVIFEPGAFTAVADGQIYLTPNEQAKKAVLDAINGMDPTGEAIYYFNPATATNKWIWGRPQIKRIGKHIFCK